MSISPTSKNSGITLTSKELIFTFCMVKMFTGIQAFDGVIFHKV